MDVSNFIIGLLEKKNKIDESVDIETLNYVEKGYVDSLGIIKFVVEIEDEFEIEFSDDELADPSFKIVGELIKLVEGKIKNNEKN
ncbi:phosphopantetheine-binding protein [Selenihalanaerobacter shriftii]|uniref:Phosphopantetheine attachment site n=1 Tax=Selenihalanaerobacter shriftii TaxID=142842 RepID=A0A1T4KMN2_9FIRM|nr:phosphopantetheine-binding protein [Selenihalanaerobacter shriftii]SJZ43649.1 Phosphopantetheine attachment site [Selenihalanaerobacter shriftii]